MAGVTLNLNQSDVTIVKYQIDRNEIRFLSVAKRCKFANPLVIAQDPFLTRGILFPTIYHLCCPRAVKIISHLEASPFFKELKLSIKSNAALGAKYINLMNFYKINLVKHIAALYKIPANGPLVKNYNLIISPPSAFENLSDNNNEGENIIEIARSLYDGFIECGLAGSREISALKCLHALYGFLIGVSGSCEEVLFFTSLIENEIKARYGSEFQNIFADAIE